MNYERIPLELKKLPQWVAVKGPGRLDCAPFDPVTGELVDTTDPAAGRPYALVAAYAKENGCRIGFILKKTDPYCFVDLDCPHNDAQTHRHRRIAAAFNSYQEISQSGTGIHIICKGAVPSGARRDNVEIYSDSRYMIMTGEVFRDAPITDQQAYVTILYSEMASYVADAVLVDTPQVQADEIVLARALNSANGDKFRSLWCGDWRGLDEYPSQSEADFALMSYLCFYSKNNEQCKRMFLSCPLGKREKAQVPAYTERMIRKIRVAEPPPINFDSLQEKLVAKAKKKRTNEEITFPPGLVGTVADYVFANAIRPVKEVALSAALAFIGGLSGRSYNISNTGLNQYIIILAPTGSGKEGAAAGIDAIINALRIRIPAIDDYLGPGSFASGQGLLRALNRAPCFVSVLGEFGLTLQQICDPNALASTVAFKRLLLDLYNKSGSNAVLRPSVYSDATKDTKAIAAPNLTILGESTPETFFHGLEQSHIAEGLIPRFLIIEYAGPRPPRNKSANIRPYGTMIDSIVGLYTVAITCQPGQTTRQVTISPEAQIMLDAFDREADDNINTGQEVDRHLWNRAHLKALKVAGLVSIGINYTTPVVDAKTAEWSINLVRRDVMGILERFTVGEVGSGDHRQELDVRRVIAEFMAMSVAQKEANKVPKKISSSAVPIIPYAYFRSKLRMKASFKNDRRGANTCIRQTLEEMVRADVLRCRGPVSSYEDYGVNSPTYTLGEAY